MSDVKNLIQFMAFLALIFIPALALTARFALRPIVDSILRLRDAFSAGAQRQQAAIADPDQLRLLQGEIADLRQSVEQLRDVVEFERALKTSDSPGQITAGKKA